MQLGMGKLKNASLPGPIIVATRGATTLLSLIFLFELDVLANLILFDMCTCRRAPEGPISVRQERG